MVQEGRQAKDAGPFPQPKRGGALAKEKVSTQGEWKIMENLRVLETKNHEKPFQPPSHSSSSCCAMQSLSKKTVFGHRRITERIRCQKRSTKGKTEYASVLDA